MAARFQNAKTSFLRVFLLLLLGGGVIGASGCVSTGNSNGQWTGSMARTYDADIGPVVNAAATAVRNVGMGYETRQVGENAYVVEATKQSGSNLGGRRVQVSGMSVHVRAVGDAGTNLQIRIPEQNTNYASRQSDSFSQKQAGRILDLLDKQFEESTMVQ